MHNAKKHFTVFLSAMALSLASLGTSISAFAEEVETTKSAETMAVSEASESTAETDNQLSEEDMKKLVDEIQDGASKDEESESDESAHDYYADDYYDTDGNATLIKHEKIIYESEEMQFIAVTTKDGNVFYILINYSADGDEDNVFFLNKVDDFDLYSLLYAGNESEKDKDPAEQSKKYADAATNGNTKSADSDSTEESTDETDSSGGTVNKKQASPMNSNMIILIGVGALAIIGGRYSFSNPARAKRRTSRSRISMRTTMKITAICPTRTMNKERR